MKKMAAMLTALATLALLTSCAPESPTGTGDACDPHAMDDIACAVEDPDQAVLNMLSQNRTREPLASMSNGEKIALAHKACDLIRVGLAAETTTIIRTLPWPGEGQETWDSNDHDIFAAGRIAYCPTLS